MYHLTFTNCLFVFNLRAEMKVFLRKREKGEFSSMDEKFNAYRQVIRIPQDPESSDLRI